MILLVGLGNPGKDYKKTRHNIGRIITDHLSDLPVNVKVIVPEKYMNESGQDVAHMVNFYKSEPEDVWVVHDDLDLPLGTVRVRFGGSSGGHRGVQSIIDNLENDKFWRIRVGIGRPVENIPTEAFVLENFTAEEAEKVKTIIDQTAAYVLKSLGKESLQEETIQIQ